MTSSEWRTISPTHPSLPGHFPGNPVVPGVVLLEEVLLSLAGWRPDSRVDGFQNVKFLRPVRPDQRFRIELEQSGSTTVTFKYSTEEYTLGSGIIILKPLKAQE